MNINDLLFQYTGVSIKWSTYSISGSDINMLYAGAVLIARWWEHSCGGYSVKNYIDDTIYSCKDEKEVIDILTQFQLKFLEKLKGTP